MKLKFIYIIKTFHPRISLYIKPQIIKSGLVFPEMLIKSFSFCNKISWSTRNWVIYKISTLIETINLFLIFVLWEFFIYLASSSFEIYFKKHIAITWPVIRKQLWNWNKNERIPTFSVKNETYLTSGFPEPVQNWVVETFIEMTSISNSLKIINFVWKRTIL